MSMDPGLEWRIPVNLSNYEKQMVISALGWLDLTIFLGRLKPKGGRSRYSKRIQKLKKKIQNGH